MANRWLLSNITANITNITSPPTSGSSSSSSTATIFTDPVGPLEYWPIFMHQLFIILIIVKLAGKLLSYMKQPPVIAAGNCLAGEILAGIIVGPSVLGQWTWWSTYVFPQTSWNYFTLVGDIGLILFMFTLGLELDETLIIKHWKQSVPISLSSICTPFVVGVGVAYWLKETNLGAGGLIWNSGQSYPAPDMPGYILFMCAAMSFTAFPVLASILTATDLISTPVGVTSVSAAALGDVLAWCALAIATSVAKGSGLIGLYVLLIAIGFVMFQMSFGRKMLDRIYSAFVDRGYEESRVFVTLEFLILLLNCYFCELLGIHSFFGAFVTGLMSPKKGNFAHAMLPKLELLTVEFLLPLFFASSGMKTNLGSLGGGSTGGQTVVVIIIAMATKIIPSALATKLVTKRDWRFSAAVGILMNTRGLVELIALNIGLSLHILSDTLFTMLIVMALVTTFCTSPLLWFVYQRSFQASRYIRADRFSTVRQVTEATSQPEVAAADPLTDMASHITDVDIELDNLPRDTTMVQNPHKVAMQLTRLVEMLPRGWDVLTDRVSGRHFFANFDLRETSWTFPEARLITMQRRKSSASSRGQLERSNSALLTAGATAPSDNPDAAASAGSTAPHTPKTGTPKTTPKLTPKNTPQSKNRGSRGSIDSVPPLLPELPPAAAASTPSETEMVTTQPQAAVSSAVSNV